VLQLAAPIRNARFSHQPTAMMNGTLTSTEPERVGWMGLERGVLL
jgi:hypothetical protein